MKLFLSIALALFAVIVLLVFNLDVHAWHDPTLINDWTVRCILIITAIGASLAAMHGFSMHYGRWINRRYHKRFHHQKHIASFKEAKVLLHAPHKPYKRAVLLLHGFTSSTADFNPLLPLLEQAGIPYYAPRLTGYGLSTLRLLRKTRLANWRKEILDAYRFLNHIADEVDVIGYSMGGMLASWLASQRKVHHLILLSPAIYLPSVSKKLLRLVSIKTLRLLLNLFAPNLPGIMDKKTGNFHDIQDAAKGHKIFSYFYNPIRGYKLLADVMRQNHFLKAEYQKLTLIYGDKDKTVNIKPLLNYIKKTDIKADIQNFAKSGHGILMDYDHQAVLDTLEKTLGQGEIA